ncbi:MAG: glycosyltransferase family 4 protein [Planctomycetaceae bacterium]
MKIAIITAGGAGMFCGSCMQDNTLARSLRLAGHDAVLVPTYTPIRVDEENVSTRRVFLGGINVYLDSLLPGWGRLPGWMIHWLNRPSILRQLTRRAGSTDASKLGPLTLDMLAGSHGPQHREIDELVSYLCGELQPDMILFSNALLSGVLSALRPKFSGRILCLFQGDDIFLDALSDRWKRDAIALIGSNCIAFDGFLTHSLYYRNHMSDYLSLDVDRFRTIPLSIDTDEAFLSELRERRIGATDTSRFTIGYFARICPEKGVHRLLQAAERLLPSMPGVQVLIAGYLGELQKSWFQTLLQRAQTKAGADRIQWLGSPSTRQQKFEILSMMDVLCVPTVYREPKGLYVLEAGLLGIPAVVPEHGAFPELIARLGHGTLVSDDDPSSLEKALRAASDTMSASAGRELPQVLATAVESHFGLQSTASVLSDTLLSLN